MIHQIQVSCPKCEGEGYTEWWNQETGYHEQEQCGYCRGDGWVIEEVEEESQQ